MVYRTALATEVRDARYVGMSDAAALADMKATARTVYVDVPASELAGAVELGGLYGKFASAAGHAAAQSLLRITRGETLVHTLAYSHPVKRGQIDTMLASMVPDVLTQQEADGLKALGIRRVTVHEIVGEPSERDIKLAREKL